MTVGRMHNQGRLLENQVFLSLRRCSEAVHYIKTKDGFDVDFYTPEDGLVQVAWHIHDAETRERELRALSIRLWPKWT